MSKTSRNLLYALLGLLLLVCCCSGIFVRRRKLNKTPKGGIQVDTDARLFSNTAGGNAVQFDNSSAPPDDGGSSGGEQGIAPTQTTEFNSTSLSMQAGRGQQMSARSKFAAGNGSYRKNVVDELTGHVEEFAAVSAILAGASSSGTNGGTAMGSVDGMPQRAGYVRRASAGAPVSAVLGTAVGTPSDPNRTSFASGNIFLASKMPNPRPITISASRSVHGLPGYNSSVHYAQHAGNAINGDRSSSSSSRQYKKRPEPLKFASLRENSVGGPVHPPSAPLSSSHGSEMLTPFSAGPAGQVMNFAFLGGNAGLAVNPKIGAQAPTDVYTARQRRVSGDITHQNTTSLFTQRAESKPASSKKSDAATESQSLPPKRRRPPTYNAPPAFDADTPASPNTIPTFNDLAAFEQWEAERASWGAVGANVAVDDEYVSVDGCQGTSGASRAAGSDGALSTKVLAAQSQRPQRKSTNWGDESEDPGAAHLSASADADEDYLPIDGNGSDDGDESNREQQQHVSNAAERTRSSLSLDVQDTALASSPTSPNKYLEAMTLNPAYCGNTNGADINEGGSSNEYAEVDDNSRCTSAATAEYVDDGFYDFQNSRAGAEYVPSHFGADEDDEYLITAGDSDDENADRPAVSRQTDWGDALAAGLIGGGPNEPDDEYLPIDGVEYADADRDGIGATSGFPREQGSRKISVLDKDDDYIPIDGSSTIIAAASVLASASTSSLTAIASTSFSPGNVVLSGYFPPSNVERKQGTDDGMEEYIDIGNGGDIGAAALVRATSIEEDDEYLNI